MMPIYEYKCEGCGEKIEIIQLISEEPLKDCSKCGREGSLRKLFSVSNIVMTQPNFFKTDWYKENSQHKPKPNRMAQSILNEPVNLTEV